MRLNVSKFINNFAILNDKLIEILKKKFHRNLRIIQITKTTKNIESQNQIVVETFTNIDVQFFKHNIFDFDKNNFVDLIFHYILNFNTKNRNQQR